MKEAHLGKRQRRAEVLTLATNDSSNFRSNNAVRLDAYRKEQTQHQPRQHSKPITLVPKSLSQETYIDLLTDPSKLIIFATGPAGTGKTMLAVLAALRAFKAGECERIVVTRPAVGVDDEQHGFLPGDLNEKMAPWTRPIFDIIGEYYRQSDIARMLDDNQIEISPLAYMRGRTFKNAWIIADEMQNATPSQMKMLLTRIGEGSKMIVTGDTRQADRNEVDNGLLNFQRLVEDYKRCKYVSGVEFNHKDIQRHPAVLEILKIYGEV
jgi:phosphate starvation-inducible PhoH-like protein